MAALSLLPLGVNGYLPSHGRQTMSFLLALDGASLLLDAGSGAARLAEPETRRWLDGSPGNERLEILLSHYHLDHVIGLSYLPGVARGRPIRIHAPRPPITAFGPESLERFIAPPLFPIEFGRWPMDVEVVGYGPGEMAIGPFAIRVRAQRHPGGSAGFRFGDALAYATDTVIDPETAAFARGVDLLLHEVWLSDEEAARDDAGRTGHSAAGAVADLARTAGVKRLGVVHHHPMRDAAGLETMRAAMQERAGLPVLILREGQPLQTG
jgi:ribonuclease BN (tRNA processing enzyme)